MCNSLPLSTCNASSAVAPFGVNAGDTMDASTTTNIHLFCPIYKAVGIMYGFVGGIGSLCFLPGFEFLGFENF